LQGDGSVVGVADGGRRDVERDGGEHSLAKYSQPCEGHEEADEGSFHRFACVRFQRRCCFKQKNRFPVGGLMVMQFVPGRIVGFEPSTVFLLSHHFKILQSTFFGRQQAN
jgi:hypothetical protein